MGGSYGEPVKNSRVHNAKHACWRLYCDINQIRNTLSMAWYQQTTKGRTGSLQNLRPSLVHCGVKVFSDWYTFLRQFWYSILSFMGPRSCYAKGQILSSQRGNQSDTTHAIWYIVLCCYRQANEDRTLWEFRTLYYSALSGIGWDSAGRSFNLR